MSDLEREMVMRTLEMLRILNERLAAQMSGLPYDASCLSCAAGCPKEECMFCKESASLAFPEYLDVLDADHVG
ncbi:MAG TPA: hypothetical protein VN256_13120 [Pyrinomonadaceae bacterium]|nr:hypothetical protein [Pyrinomonadaceae bacterium]